MEFMTKKSIVWGSFTISQKTRSVLSEHLSFDCKSTARWGCAIINYIFHELSRQFSHSIRQCLNPSIWIPFNTRENLSPSLPHSLTSLYHLQFLYFTSNFHIHWLLTHPLTVLTKSKYKMQNKIHIPKEQEIDELERCHKPELFDLKEFDWWSWYENSNLIEELIVAIFTHKEVKIFWKLNFYDKKNTTDLFNFMVKDLCLLNWKNFTYLVLLLDWWDIH